jgi:hypothetical protein
MKKLTFNSVFCWKKAKIYFFFIAFASGMNTNAPEMIIETSVGPSIWLEFANM